MVIKSHLNTLLDIYINAFPSPLCIKLPQMNAYAKYFDKNSKYKNLLDNTRILLKKYQKNTIKYGIKHGIFGRFI